MVNESNLEQREGMDCLTVGPCSRINGTIIFAREGVSLPEFTSDVRIPFPDQEFRRRLFQHVNSAGFPLPRSVPEISGCPRSGNSTGSLRVLRPRTMHELRGGEIRKP
jgi:hypothetical protein